MRAVAPQMTLLVDDVGVGLEGDAAAFHLGRRPGRAHGVASGSSSTASTSLADGRQATPAGIVADERVDHVAGRERRGRRQLAEQAAPAAAQADLLLGLAQRRVAQVGVLGVRRPPGKEISPAWRRRSARRLVSTTCGSASSRGEEQRHEHRRRIDLLARADPVRSMRAGGGGRLRRPGERAQCAPGT